MGGSEVYATAEWDELTNAADGKLGAQGGGMYMSESRQTHHVHSMGPSTKWGYNDINGLCMHAQK